jgi:hypothetical protein
MRLSLFALAAVSVALGLSACGESAEDKALASVCAARDDISKQVDELKSLTPATLTVDGVKGNLTAIRTDLEDISSAQSDLGADRRSEVETATKEFASSVREIASEVVTSVSAEDAKAAIVTALQQLQASYEDTLKPVNCD